MLLKAKGRPESRPGFDRPALECRPVSHHRAACGPGNEDSTFGIEPGEVGQDTLPVCLFDENPNGLVSLWAMLQVHARRFVTLLDDLGRLQLQFSKGTAFDDPRVLGSVLSAVRQDCELLDLVSASKQVETIRDTLGRMSDQRITPTWSQLTGLIAELRRRIEEDLEECVFFQVPPDKRRRCFKRNRKDGITEFTLKTAAEFLGAEVVTQFPSAALDIEEAEKCFSRGCETACVFHLQRVMEIGLRALGHSLNNPNLDPKRNPSWESILKKSDEELQKPAAQRSPEWQTAPQFFAEATANLRAVKDAWRNPTMHIQVWYDAEKATEVVNSVGAFMRHLATRLHE